MKKRLLLLISVFMVLLLSCDDPASSNDHRGILTGRIIDFHTGEPLSNAPVYTTPGSDAIYTDATGHFTFDNIVVGESTVHAKKAGYYTESIPVRILAGRITTAVLPLRSELSDNTPPKKPVLLFPSDKQRLNAKSIRLSWTSSDEDGDDIIFDVYIAAASDPLIMVTSDVEEFEYAPESLEDSTEYHWKIVARDEHGATSESQVFTFTTDSYQQEVNEENLLLFIDFENDSFSDKSSHNHIVTNTNVSLAKKDGRNCGLFNDSENSMLRLQGLYFNTDGAFTAACHVYIEGSYGTTTTSHIDVLSRFGGTGSGAASWNLAINKNRQLASQSYDGDNVGVVASVELVKQGRWCHIAVVRDGKSSRLYMDGVLAGETTTVLAQDSDYELCVGGRPDNNAHFNGHMDNVFFYSRALSESEIKALAQ